MKTHSSFSFSVFPLLSSKGLEGDQCRLTVTSPKNPIRSVLLYLSEISRPRTSPSSFSAHTFHPLYPLSAAQSINWVD
uniref:SJCHGC09792 protein n=1 Tax=Schistosoma japonicum TaxID=6182 RepID=Q5BQV7_SCHJA|nr:SJCHGC09792 protein [Schistosoma japonicum]